MQLQSVTTYVRKFASKLVKASTVKVFETCGLFMSIINIDTTRKNMFITQVFEMITFESMIQMHET